MNADRERFDKISDRVMGRAFTVANTLGAGFPEKVSENAPGDKSLSELNTTVSPSVLSSSTYQVRAL
jgi:hypothetical protein